MKVHSTADLEAYWDKLSAFEASYYKPRYYDAKEQILGEWLPSGFYFYNFVTNSDTDEIEAVLGFTVFAQDQFERLYNSDEVTPKKLPSFKPAEVGFKKPIVYLASMIIQNRMHAPYLFKSISSEMKKAQDIYNVKFNDVASIGLNKKADFLLRRYGLEKVAEFRGLDIRMTTRERCGILNAILS